MVFWKPLVPQLLQGLGGRESRVRLRREVLAKDLWKHRYTLFKAGQRMSCGEHQALLALMEADPKIGRFRAFLNGVWHLFEDSQDEAQARAALDALKRQPLDAKRPKPFQNVVRFLEDNFTWMTAYPRHEHVQRNSLAESGMRLLRGLEIEHDGFRSDHAREDFLRIYQAIKYLGWSAYAPLTSVPKQLLDRWDTLIH